MKRLIPIALLSAAVGAAALILNKNNKQHVEQTIKKLDEISKKAGDTITEFAEEIVEKFDSHE